VVMLAPVPVAFALSEADLIPSFAIPAAVALFIGVILWRKFERTDLTLGKAMVLVTLAWILMSLFGSMPYIFGHDMGFLDAYFESMSGFTTTGLTVIQGPAGELLPVPQTILFWRSLTQWVGGLGVIVLFLAALLGAGKAARKLYVAEARAERIEPSIRETARSLWKIYVLFTLAGIIGLFLAGMELFPAINHSMVALATGGFTVTGDSFAGYGPQILMIALIIMMAGATSFAIHRKVVGGDWRVLFKSVEVRLMIILIIIGTFVLAWSVGLKDALFHSVSAQTTVGFSTASGGVISGPEWGPFQKGVLSTMMVVGGGFGSTASAIKLIRTIVIIGAVYWVIKRSFLPERAVVPIKIGGRIYSEREVMETAIYAFIYILVLGCGALIVMMAMPGESGMDCLFESASAQGNVGLSVGITAVAVPVVKVVFIIQMLVGRLEILPVIAFLSYIVGRVPRRHRVV
ncbi:MAG: TrkH family potassium uptake protein, partial [Candidatus Hadarchaeota archaeon]|nr:TrkH family potassium uptake protein [Candidatus Hadarchaeota archaeon]